MNFNRSIILVFNFYIKKLYCNSEIFYIKLFAKTVFNYKDIFFIIFDDNKIINIEGDIYIFVVGIFINEDIEVKLTLLKVKVD